MKETIELLEKDLKTKEEELQQKLREEDALRATINQLLGALKLAYSILNKGKQPEPELVTDDTITDNSEPTSDK